MHLLGVFSLAGFNSSRVFGDTSVWLDKAEVHAFFHKSILLYLQDNKQRSTMKTQSLKQKVRQNFTTKLLILFFAGFMITLQSCGQETKAKTNSKEPDYSQVNYAARSNIIKRPKKLKGDEKAIFYHPFFLKLTSDEARNLDVFKMKKEFSRLGITTDEKERFQIAYSFFRIEITFHKKSCEQWESFKDLAPNSHIELPRNLWYNVEMRNNLENSSAMLKSANSLEFADSSERNHSSLTLEQQNYRLNEQKTQRKFREKIENNEHENADKDLETELSSLEIINQIDLDDFLDKNFPNSLQSKKLAQEYYNEQISLGFSVTIKFIRKYILKFVDKKEEISTADQIKNFKEELAQQGKSQSEILKILIEKFENEEAVSVWVENWRNFQKLSEFAESKPPKERRAIENIISKADFTSENAFATSLTEISQSSEISNATKLEISREFNGARVFSVNDLDNGLKQQQTRKTEIENAINSKSREKTALSSDIENLEDELEKLPLNDPKRQELEEKIEQKKEVLKQTKSDIVTLEKAKPKEVSFSLRSGFSAKLNDDGTRSIRINSRDFAIKLPSNFLPFTDTKNLRSINLAFPYLALKNQDIANIIFSPNLENNSVPTKRNRDMSHLILSTLKIDDSQILSENNILQLNKDLSRLTSVQNGKSSQEKLIDLGVFDITSQSLDKEKFRGILTFIRENRGLNDDVFWGKIKR